MKDSDFAWIDDLVREAAEEDEVLRYVAILQLQPTPGASVELRRYPKSHDLACCGTTDHVAAIYSSRCVRALLPVVGYGARDIRLRHSA